MVDEVVNPSLGGVTTPPPTTEAAPSAPPVLEGKTAAGESVAVLDQATLAAAAVATPATGETVNAAAVTAAKTDAVAHEQLPLAVEAAKPKPPEEQPALQGISTPLPSPVETGAPTSATPVAAEASTPPVVPEASAPPAVVEASRIPTPIMKTEFKKAETKPKVDKLEVAKGKLEECKNDIATKEAALAKAGDQDKAKLQEVLCQAKCAQADLEAACQKIQDKREQVKIIKDNAVHRFDKAFLNYVTQEELQAAQPSPTDTLNPLDTKEAQLLQKYKKISDQDKQDISELKKKKTQEIETNHAKIEEIGHHLDKIEEQNIAKKNEIAKEACQSNPAVVDNYKAALAKKDMAQDKLKQLQNVLGDINSKLNLADEGPSTDFKPEEEAKFISEVEKLQAEIETQQSELRAINDEIAKATLPPYVKKLLDKVHEQDVELTISKNTPKVFTLAQRDNADKKRDEAANAYFSEVYRLNKGDLRSALDRIQARSQTAPALPTLQKPVEGLKKGSETRTHEHETKTAEQQISDARGEHAVPGKGRGPAQKTEGAALPRPAVETPAQAVPLAATAQTATPQAAPAAQERGAPTPHLAGTGAPHAHPTLKTAQGEPAAVRAERGQVAEAPLGQPATSETVHATGTPQPLQMATSGAPPRIHTEGLYISSPIQDTDTVETAILRIHEQKFKVREQMDQVAEKNGIPIGQILVDDVLMYFTDPSLSKSTPDIVQQMTPEVKEKFAQLFADYEALTNRELVLSASIAQPQLSEEEEFALDDIVAQYERPEAQGPTPSRAPLGAQQPLASASTQQEQARAAAPFVAAAHGDTSRRQGPQTTAQSRDVNTRLPIVEGSAGSSTDQQGGGRGGEQGGREFQGEIVLKDKRRDPVTGDYIVVVTIGAEDYKITMGGYENTDAEMEQTMKSAATLNQIRNMAIELGNMSKLYEGRDAHVALTAREDNSKQFDVSYKAQDRDEIKTKTYTADQALVKLSKWENTIAKMDYAIELNKAELRTNSNLDAAAINRLTADNQELQNKIDREKTKQKVIGEIFNVAVPRTFSRKPLPPLPPKARAAEETKANLGAAATSAEVRMKRLEEQQKALREKADAERAAQQANTLSPEELQLLQERDALVQVRREAERTLGVNQGDSELNTAWTQSKEKVAAFDRQHPGLQAKGERLKNAAQPAPAAQSTARAAPPPPPPPRVDPEARKLYEERATILNKFQDAAQSQQAYAEYDAWEKKWNQVDPMMRRFAEEEANMEEAKKQADSPLPRTAPPAPPPRSTSQSPIGKPLPQTPQQAKAAAEATQKERLDQLAAEQKALREKANAASTLSPVEKILLQEREELVQTKLAAVKLHAANNTDESMRAFKEAEARLDEFDEFNPGVSDKGDRIKSEQQKAAAQKTQTPPPPPPP